MAALVVCFRGPSRPPAHTRRLRASELIQRAVDPLAAFCGCQFVDLSVPCRCLRAWSELRRSIKISFVQGQSGVWHKTGLLCETEALDFVSLKTSPRVPV